MAYLLVTLSWGGRVHGRTSEQNYEDDLYDRFIDPEEKEITQTVDEKFRPEVYQGEDTPNLDNYQLQHQDLRRGNCVKTRKVIYGIAVIECNGGCRVTCVPPPTYK